jgi:DNA gyrase inhibitor GyrI
MYIIETSREDGSVIGGRYTVYTNKETAEQCAAAMRESFQKWEHTATWTVKVVEATVKVAEAMVIDW